MKTQLILFICIILVNGGRLFAQNIEARVLDADSKIPVAFASVFISNTSLGTTTDTSGLFRFNMNGLPQGELVLSHLGYQTKSILIKNGSLPESVIYLKPQENTLDEVMIVADHSKKRKKWLRQFNNAFLGKTSNSKKTYILNPEVLIFEEINDSLKVTTTDYLKVRNEALGYNIQFHLEEFRLGENRFASYAGKVFFQSIGQDESKKASIERNRSNTYELSQAHFFNSLLADSLEQHKYAIGTSKINPSIKGYIFQKKPQMSWKSKEE